MRNDRRGRYQIWSSMGGSLKTILGRNCQRQTDGVRGVLEGHGKAPKWLRWVDTDKSEGIGEPNVRSRLVPVEVLLEHSATSPLEAVRLLLSWTATETKCSTCLTLDVSRACFCPPSPSPTYVMIPEEDMSEGDQTRYAKFNASLYSTRDAPKISENKYSSEQVMIGFWRGRANPCGCCHEGWGVRLVVHDDNFLCAGADHKVQRYIDKMKGRTTRQSAAGVMNRRVRWRRGITWGADPRHVLKAPQGALLPADDEIRHR